MDLFAIFTKSLKKHIKQSGSGTYKLNKGLVVIGADVAFGVDDLAEGLAELDELLIRAFPRQIPEVEHLRWRLRVPELRLSRGRHLQAKGCGDASSIRLYDDQISTDVNTKSEKSGRSSSRNVQVRARSGEEEEPIAIDIEPESGLLYGLGGIASRERLII
ncbi:hypothetical protein BHE74_00052281 [Ensete ventricosum]|nr:hypothetical protein GW17_00016037 [Ensete ventricosum]RWW42183.1 hypothetical protein BHE74_00052281 [Ensete ventricosum]RZS20884.1 hypothetical protein BHM03_00053451 [Ensete ventricosum]